MKALDLWGSIDVEENNPEENLAVDILRDQARLIREKTNGAVKASFVKIEYEYPGALATVGAFEQVLDYMKKEKKRETDSEDIDRKEDINSLFEKKSYKFELYNDVYKYRVFILHNSIEFPIEIEVEDGIRNELGLDPKKSIDSNSSFISLITEIFTSNKMRIVLARMQSSARNEYQEKILSYLKENPASNIKSISQGVMLSNVTTKKYIEELIENNRIQTNVAGKTKLYSIVD